MDKFKPIIAITQGDPNGVGYEVIIKALEHPHVLELCTPVIYGSAKIASFYRKALQLPQVTWQQVANVDEVNPDAINIINVTPEDYKVEPGVASQQGGQEAFAALEAAVADLKAGKVHALVTAPINKNTIHSEQFNFPGHTEYLEAQLGGEDDRALMILYDENIRIALVTTHLPITQVAEGITRERIVECLRVLNDSLRSDFAITAPRIAVLGLNPHAGDNGLLGREEQEIISPAIEEARQMKILAFGPYPADGFFGNGLYKRFDGVLAMYHDQGLAPFKTLAMDAGVNFTAGLPYVRTSPDHGTAYDIAGKGEASESSMRAAIYQAVDLLRNRLVHRKISANPLRRKYFDRGKDNVVLDLTKDE
ncbi:MAG: 4-hydroxythreonine-4-phosphate dehydrogenase PdxA [Muribaculaceae bacterium]|nr:4-hydroxythreonine-4-phosphate dehydrogenase PdxA [Muribaculaceae bacterium]